jgi:hypothetical protein
MQTWKWFGLWIISLLGLILAIPAVPIQVAYRIFSRKYDNKKYFRELSVGNDVSLGSMIYGSKHTISAITGHKAYHGSWWHKQQAKVIDYLFGKNHCLNEAVDEQLINPLHG